MTEARPAPETVAALGTLLTHDARFVRLVAEEAERTLGADGTAAVERGLRAYGAWLARTIPARTSSEVPAGSVRALLLAWDLGELAVGGETGWSTVTGTRDGVRLRLRRTPPMRHFDEQGVPSLGPWYYTQVFTGVTTALGADPAQVSADSDTLTFRWFEEHADSALRPTATADGSRLLLHTAQGRGALMALVGQSLLTGFGATGEFCLRTAMSRFGAERGELLRAGVTAKGLETNIMNMIENYDSGGHTSVWRWAEGGELSPSRQFQDCTFCPFIPVWRELDAMEIGGIYDYEFHVAQFRAFNPAIRLRWETLQTRGDDRCGFRFTLPGA
ncbi:L-2-amino-thiazoline-4-carboxylic acid hydrolase [Streptomyces sp. NPDC056188]|uniref:L-2-amino-thiazoline-4-carboxylic acid hydrolase n=1 Tax=Streptomyces sp. NPDC056188 TaxID=3345740 RepID=UPI0035DC2557